MGAKLPEVGDEVEHVSGRSGVVTDICKGEFILRCPGQLDWPVSDPTQLTVTRCREERVKAGDFR
ncbi:hypothetical protein [Streptomyces sp. NPDC048650]|uniref:hypothetical protein n=1 Tax=unclassified Streptomyces TaxID=2593676 RepID=UPI00371BF6BF